MEEKILKRSVVVLKEKLHNDMQGRSAKREGDVVTAKRCEEISDIFKRELLFLKNWVHVHMPDFEKEYEEEMEKARIEFYKINIDKEVEFKELWKMRISEVEDGKD